jgi:putative hydrolase of the HAD superfamily
VDSYGELRGIITDWGGVLTTPILTTVRSWIEADGIDWVSYRDTMRSWVAQAYDSGAEDEPGNEPGNEPENKPGNKPENKHGPNPIHALERGECSGAEFEQILAARLLRVDGAGVAAEGLLRRMFAASLPVPAMYDTIRTLRAAGFSTALLSNSWGCDEYPRADFPGLFDTVVLSGEVGMRKPEKEIFLHAAETLGLAPAECVFIDDMEANVAAAQACGMTGVLHTETASTARALQDLLGVPLAWSAPAT